MIKSQLIFCSIAVISTLLMPQVLDPAAAATKVGPITIPGNLIPTPVPGTASPIVPYNPNLGTVPIALPPLEVYSIKQVTSGLVASDSLTNETETQQQLEANPGYWTYGGDAPAEKAPYTFFRDTQGLHIGVQSPADGNYSGYYAESPRHNAQLWHATISTPLSALPTTANDYYENGLYVQTYDGSVNYVSCFSDTSLYGTVWAVGTVTGNNIQGTQFNVLWVDTSANQPLTRDCTLVTNGQNLFKAYIDGNLVYSNSTQNLTMPSPFNAYLEPETSYAGQMLNGTYTDYYATTNETVTVTNNPALATTVDLVSPSGTVLASAPVNSGTATLDIGNFDMPLDAYIKIYGTGGVQLASTSTPVNIFGGDQYSVSLLGL
jgi:hypothetical protein